MQHRYPPSPPRVGMRIGQTVRPALPVMIGGQRATFVVEPAPRPYAATRLRLDWEDGSVTELDGRISGVDELSRTTHVDICGIQGAWRPFLAYLAFGGI